MLQRAVDNRRLVLRYASGGQFSFRKFVADASDESLHELAGHLNAFQDEPSETVSKVDTFIFRRMV